MEKLPRKKILRKALKTLGSLLSRKNLLQAVALANKVAPEHLLLAVKDPYRLLEKVKNAGSVFLGHFSPVAAGDTWPDLTMSCQPQEQPGFLHP